MSTFKRAVTPGEKVAISDVPQVQKVMDLKLEIDALKGEFPEVFMRLADLVDRYNTAVEDAEKIVRATGITCGPFVNFSSSVRYNAEKMYDELGEELFFKAGGKLAEIPVYSVDKEVLEASIQNGTVPEETLEHFRTLERKYKKPEKLATI